LTEENLREELTNVSYTTWWIEHARKELAEKPDSVLHHYTHINYSGGVSGWEDFINRVYFSPATIEEKLLQGEVHCVMVQALENAFKRAEAEDYDGTWTAWSGMDLSEAYRVSHMVARVDPLIASAAKMRLNRIAARMGTTLYALGERNFGTLMGLTGIKW
jgi:hypothetical protein